MSHLELSRITVEKIMTVNVTTLDAQMSIQEIIELFLQEKISGAPVVDKQRKVLSIVSEADLMKIAALNGLDIPLQKVLSTLPKAEQLITVKRTELFKDVFKQFLTNPVRRVIVVDDVFRLQGIVSRRNLIRAFLHEKKAAEND